MTSWYERAVPGGTDWHYIVLDSNEKPLSPDSRCACEKYAYEELSVTPFDKSDGPPNMACRNKAWN